MADTHKVYSHVSNTVTMYAHNNNNTIPAKIH